MPLNTASTPTSSTSGQQEEQRERERVGGSTASRDSLVSGYNSMGGQIMDVVQFKTPVRTKQVKALQIINRTGQNWKLKPPVIDNFDCWTGEKLSGSISVPAGQTTTYEVTYHPMFMTQNVNNPVSSNVAGLSPPVPTGLGGLLGEKRHKGSMFFAMSDGSALVYELIGISLPPLPSDTIVRKVPCRMRHNEELTVRNWSKTPQRFKVTIEIVDQAAITNGLAFSASQVPNQNASADSLTTSSIMTLKGLDYIDVPPLLERQYKLMFQSLKDCTVHVRVVFRNEETKEFQFYLMTFTASASDSAVYIVEMESPVRQTTSRNLVLENPLQDVWANFTTSLTPPSLDIYVPPTISIPPSGETSFDVIFLPLSLRESNVRLTLTSDILGVYHYDLILKSSPPNREKGLVFKVAVGTRQAQTFHFVSYIRGTNVDYQIKIQEQGTDFEPSDRSITCTPMPPPIYPLNTITGVDVGVDVVYEPSKLGSQQATLIVTCVQLPGVEYQCPLIGHALPPKPQGPISIKSGQSVTLPLRNVFPKTTVFQMLCDNPRFSVRPTEITVGPKKIAPLTLFYRVSDLTVPPATQPLSTPLTNTLSTSNTTSNNSNSSTTSNNNNNNNNNSNNNNNNSSSSSTTSSGSSTAAKLTITSQGNPSLTYYLKGAN